MAVTLYQRVIGSSLPVLSTRTSGVWNEQVQLGRSVSWIAPCFLRNVQGKQRGIASAASATDLMSFLSKRDYVTFTFSH